MDRFKFCSVLTFPLIHGLFQWPTWFSQQYLHTFPSIFYSYFTFKYWLKWDFTFEPCASSIFIFIKLWWNLLLLSTQTNSHTLKLHAQSSFYTYSMHFVVDQICYTTKWTDNLNSMKEIMIIIIIIKSWLSSASVNILKLRRCFLYPQNMNNTCIIIVQK